MSNDAPDGRRGPTLIDEAAEAQPSRRSPTLIEDVEALPEAPDATKAPDVDAPEAQQPPAQPSPLQDEVQAFCRAFSGPHLLAC